MTVQREWSAMRPIIIGVSALVILVGGFGSWAALTQISGAIIASGQIEVDRNRQVVQHPDGGVVAAILVDEGDTVVAGEALVRLDDTLLRSDLTTVESQLYEMMARRARFEAERDEVGEIAFAPELLEVAAARPEVLDLVQGQERLFQARISTNQQQIEQLQLRGDQITSQIGGVIAQQEALTIQLGLIQEELVAQKALFERGLTPASQVLSLQREEARLRGSVGELTASAAQSEERITEIKLEILRLASTRREQAISQIRDLQFRELDMAEQRRSLLERLSRLEIRSPVSGVVYGMTVFAERSVIRAAEPVLFVVPQDRPLVIAARIEAIHIDQVYLDQEVVLRFSAFDARTTPEFFGTVTQVSADVFMDEASRVSFYRVELVLKPNEIAKIPAGLTLIPGMPVEAFLRTEDRTPIAYLVRPLADYFSKAFRES